MTDRVSYRQSMYIPVFYRTDLVRHTLLRQLQPRKAAWRQPPRGTVRNRRQLADELRRLEVCVLQLRAVRVRAAGDVARSRNVHRNVDPDHAFNDDFAALNSMGTCEPKSKSTGPCSTQTCWTNL